MRKHRGTCPDMFVTSHLRRESKQGDNRHPGRDSGERGEHIIVRAYERQGQDYQQERGDL